MIERFRVRVSVRQGSSVGGVNLQRYLHPQYHDWGALEQDTEPSTAPRAPQHEWLSTAPGVCSRCVCVCVCALDGLNAEHKFRVWVTILGRMSHHFHCIKTQHITKSLKHKIIKNINKYYKYCKTLVVTLFYFTTFNIYLIFILGYNKAKQHFHLYFSEE